MEKKKAKKPQETSAVPEGTHWHIDPKDRNTTACKHGTGNCEVCGSYNRDSVRHTTVGGRGLAAQLRAKK